jgi:hypothetical protein
MENDRPGRCSRCWRNRPASHNHDPPSLPEPANANHANHHHQRHPSQPRRSSVFALHMPRQRYVTFRSPPAIPAATACGHRFRILLAPPFTIRLPLHRHVPQTKAHHTDPIDRAFHVQPPSLSTRPPLEISYPLISPSPRHGHPTRPAFRSSANHRNPRQTTVNKRKPPLVRHVCTLPACSTFSTP